MDSMEEYFPVTSPDENREDLDFLGDFSNTDEALGVDDSDYSEEFDGEELTPSPSPVVQEFYSSDLSQSDPTDDEDSTPVDAINKSAPVSQAKRRQRARTAAVHGEKRRPAKPKVQTYVGLLRRGLNYLGLSKNRAKNMEKTATGTSNATSFRLLSAKQREVDQIHNELTNVRKNFDTLQRENRTLKTLQQRQDRAIRLFEDVESDIPKMMHRHTEEQKVLKTRLRKAQISERELEAKLRANNNDMQKMEKKLRRLKEIVQRENLGERIALARRLENTNSNLTVAERTIEKLDKKLGLTVNSFTRQIRMEKLRHKETKEQLQKIRRECLEAENRLREKERALGAANIYCHRKKESPKKLHKAVGAVALARDEELMSRCTQTEREDSPSRECTKFSTPCSPGGKEQLSSPEAPAFENEDDSNAEPEPNVTTEKPGFETPEINRNIRITDRVHYKSGVQEGTPAMEKVFGNKTPVFVTSKYAPPPQLRCAPVTTSCEVSSVSIMVNTHSPNSFIKDTDANMNSRGQNGSSSPSVPQLATPEQEVLPITCDRQTVERCIQDVERYEDACDKEPQHRKQQVESPAARRRKKTYQFSQEVQNLHLGIPSVVEVRKGKQKEEVDEVHFGGYTPTIGAAPVRKKDTVNTAVGNDASLDKKGSDFLKQLFGELDSSKLRNPQEPEAESFVTGTRKLLKSFKEEGLLDDLSSTAHRSHQASASYPWEKNVVTSSNLQGNGDNVGVPSKVATPRRLVRAESACLEDDLEQLTL